MTSDVLGSLAFGGPFRLVEKEEVRSTNSISGLDACTDDDPQKSEFIKDIEISMIMAGVKTELSFLWFLIKDLPIPGLGRPTAFFKRMADYGQVAVRNTKAAPKGSAKTLFSKMIPEEGEQLFPDSLIAMESSNIIIAGSDTTAMVLTYLVYRVLLDPDVKRKLLEELSTICSKTPGWEELEGIPYLNNVITETLRLYSPVPGTLPRTAPKGGAMLAGYKISGGVTVATQAYTFHRDPGVWEEPERYGMHSVSFWQFQRLNILNRFNPDRWEHLIPR